MRVLKNVTTLKQFSELLLLVCSWKHCMTYYFSNITLWGNRDDAKIPWSRDLIEATCLAGRFFTVWATREVVYSVYLIFILSSINGHLGCFYGLVGSSGGSDGKKNLAWNAGDAGLIPGLGSYLDKGRATHSSILSWRIPWTEESCGLPSIGS